MDKIFNISKSAAAAYVVYKLVKLWLTDADLDTYDCALDKNYFRNKVVWITGASSGIGLEIATQLSKLKVGVKLILSARRKAELEKLSEALECESVVVPVDLFELDSLDEVAKSALEAFGRVDVLFNNGGISTRALAENTDFSVDEKIMKIDYLSYVKLAKLVLPQMIERKSGHIVNISSLAGKLGSPMRSAYSGAKFALIGHFDSLRLEVARYNIQVTNICPGSVQTEVDKNALTSTGENFGVEDPDIQNGMTVSRAAERMLAAMSNGIHEVWLFGNPLQKFVTYMAQYTPALTRSLTMQQSDKLIKKAEKLMQKSAKM